MANADQKLVLLYSTIAEPSRAARLHAEACPMTNTLGNAKEEAGVLIGRKVHGHKGTEAELKDVIDDLNERGYPVKKCKCCKCCK